MGKSDKSAIGVRMKENYEKPFKLFLSRRTYTMIRLDGKAFHTFTKGMNRPFDDLFVTCMDMTAKYLCENVQGCKLAYTQSDEITLVLSDFDTNQTQLMHGGSLQKICSISASMATAKFNQIFHGFRPNQMIRLAMFDSRVFQISSRDEVINNLIWRQQDATRNSIGMASQALYSHKELMGVDTNQAQEMMFKKGVNWNDYPVRLKRGGVVRPTTRTLTGPHGEYERKSWSMDPNTPIFSKNKEYFETLIPYLR